jgi:uncharacterized protein (TIGR02757 family)
MALQEVCRRHGDFEGFWRKCSLDARQQQRPLLALFHERFTRASNEMALRTHKHFSNPETGSPCKRLYMYLRWTVRKGSPVDLGIWDFIRPADLRVPFDVHVARQARRYGLTTRRTNDWKTVEELTATLAKMNPADPSRYDYALFGIGALGHELPRKFILNRV